MKKFKFEIKQDPNPSNPRSWDNLGTMVCFHRRYNLGDENYYCSNNYDSWDEMKEDIINNENVHTILPLYLYDHSGIAMNTTGFSCNWDSGQVGFIFISKDKVKKECMDESKVELYLKNEVETYNQYLTGEVWRYEIYEITECNHGHKHIELIDSCSGFYDENHCKEEANNLIKYYENLALDKINSVNQ